jgi:hypothetical protein
MVIAGVLAEKQEMNKEVLPYALSGRLANDLLPKPVAISIPSAVVLYSDL